MESRYDVVIIGAGLAGLCLARQIQRERPGLQVLHLEKNATVPMPRQKVGESTVQIQGHYLSKILGLESHLFHEHFMKYNLRFHWPKKGRLGTDYFELDQSYIRNFSNIPSFQVDRNVMESHLAKENQACVDYELLTGISKLEMDLAEQDGMHQVSFFREGKEQVVKTRWLVDSSGRNRRLAKSMGSKKKLDIRHSASYFWLDGSLDVSSLTQLDPKQQRLHERRRQMGHLPFWLATNHFMGDGYWFWVIAIKGRTSFGLVYDQNLVNGREVKSYEGLKSWLLARYPMFHDFFEDKEPIDFSVIHNFGHDCQRTLDANRWAVTGEAGRFSDPLYSPGGDLMAIHNTLIVDAIGESDPTKLKAKVSNYEVVCQAMFKSFLPSYDPGYDALGDQECFTIKYTWELAIYFGFFVFPFINELFTDRNFLIPWFRRLSMLGGMNEKVLAHIHTFVSWKKTEGRTGGEPCSFDFTRVKALAQCAESFYEIGLSAKEAVRVLNRLLGELEEAARYFMTYIDARMTGRPELLNDKAHITSFDFGDGGALPEGGDDLHGDLWSFCPSVLSDAFWPKET